MVTLGLFMVFLSRKNEGRNLCRFAAVLLVLNAKRLVTFRAARLFRCVITHFAHHSRWHLIITILFSEYTARPYCYIL